jgi:hypothetical protein
MNSPATKTILILTANPKQTKPLQLAQEVRDIQEGLQRSSNCRAFRLEQRWAVRSRDVQRALLDANPQILHFSGHGFGEEGLAFEDESSDIKWVDADALAGLFQLFADQLECVVLNACYSAIQAQAICQFVPAVIGMKQAIGDRAAIEFAVGFYDAIGAGRSIEFAYQLGCRAIRMAGIAENLTPVLHQKPAPAPLLSLTPADNQPASTQLSSLQKRRLVQKRDILETELNLRMEKLRQLRESWAIEVGTAIKFQLQKQIQNEEVQTAALENQLQQIEKDL